MKRNMRLIHDISQSMAKAQLDRLAHLYREEERRELFAMFYEAGKAALEYFEAHAERGRRMTPSAN